MTRIAARPARRPARSTRGCSASASLIGLAALTRNEAIWLGADLGASSRGGSPGLDRAAPGRLDRRSPRSSRSLVFAPWAIRDWVVFGSPLPGQAVANALLGRPASTSSPGTIRRRSRATWRSGRRGCSRCGSRASATTCSASCCCLGLPISLHRPARAAVAGPRRGRSGRSCSSASSTFLVTSLVFPVATTWGTFLHAAGPVHVLLVVLGPARARRRHRPARRPARLDPAGRLARPGARHLRLAAVLGRAAAVVRRRARATRPTQYAELGRRMAAAGHPLDAIGRAGHHQLPDLARRDRADRRPRPARRAAGATCSTSPRRSRRPGCSSSSSRRARSLAGRPRRPAPRRRLLPRARPRRPGEPASRPTRSRDTRAFEIVCP